MLIRRLRGLFEATDTKQRTMTRKEIENLRRLMDVSRFIMYCAERRLTEPN